MNRHPDIKRIKAHLALLAKFRLKSTYCQMPEEDGRRGKKGPSRCEYQYSFHKIRIAPKVRPSTRFRHLGRWIKFARSIRINHFEHTHVWLFFLPLFVDCDSDIPLNSALRVLCARRTSKLWVLMFSRETSIAFAYVIRSPWGESWVRWDGRVGAHFK